MHGPSPVPFPGVKDGPSEPPALEKRSCLFSHRCPCPALLSGAQGALLQPDQPLGKGCCPAISSGYCPGPPSNPPPNSGDKAINDSSFWAGDGSASQERGNHRAWGLPPITLDPSVAWKVPPGPGPLAKADTGGRTALISHGAAP